MVCLPCAAAAGPPGIAIAAVGTVGYGVYKSTTKKKKKGKKKLSKKKLSKNKKGGSKQFKKGEIVTFKLNDGSKKDFKFVRYVNPNKISIRFLKKGKKYNPVLTVDASKIEKIPKKVVNTKKRQKTKRAKLVRKKRGIKTKSTTLDLPNSNDSVDDLMKDMKI